MWQAVHANYLFRILERAIYHIFEGIKVGWSFRHELRRLVEETPAETRLVDLDPVKLAADGIKVLALDFDGVLGQHGSDQPLPEVTEWLVRTVSVFGEDQIIILSNRPFGPRVEWFKTNMPGIRFVSGVKKKPYPDGLVKAGELASVSLSAILMVDDRLLTGCLSAIQAGSRIYYIRNPYISLRTSFVKELFFMLLRRAERLFVIKTS